MGKRPSFQFYPGDWSREPGLKMASLEVKGAWAEILFTMFDAEDQGKLKGSLADFARLLRIDPWGCWEQRGSRLCTPWDCGSNSFNGTALDILSQLINLRVCDVEYHTEATEKLFSLPSENDENLHTLTPPDFFLTIINRRMWREHNSKLNQRKRQHRYEAKKKGMPIDAQSDANLTPPSSISSSFSKEKGSTRAQEKFEVPEWLPEEVWNLYLENRTARKGKIPKGGYQVLLDKLGRIREMGYDIREVVNTMVEKGWVSFDPSWNHGLKPKHGGSLVPYQGKSVEQERREREEELAEDRRLHPELYEDAAKVIKMFGMEFTDRRK